jgi:hypothetical protein
VASNETISVMLTEGQGISITDRFFKLVEHPLLQTIIGIVAGLVGIFVYGPFLIFFSILVLVALHRSGALDGLTPLKKVGSYLLAAIVSILLLGLAGNFIEKHRDHIHAG